MTTFTIGQQVEATESFNVGKTIIEKRTKGVIIAMAWRNDLVAVKFEGIESNVYTFTSDIN